MVRMAARLCLALSCLLVASLGCSGGSQSPKCIPGLTVDCPCRTGQQGSQTCTSAGTFAACVCAAPGADAGRAGDGAATSPLDAVITGGSGDSAGVDGPVVDATVGQSADVLAVPDAAPHGGDALADSNLAADAPLDLSSADALPEAAADTGEREEAPGTPPAILSFSASPTTISAGKSSTLSWTVTGATMLFIDQGVGSNLVSVLGATSLVVTPTQTTTYALTLDGSISAWVTVTVVPLPTIASFFASPAVVTPGGSSILTAVFSGGTGAVDQGIGAVTSGIGTSTGPIIAITTYTLTVTNTVGGSTTAQVTVVPAGPPPPSGLAVYVTQKIAGSTNGLISLSFRIDNQTSASVDLSNVTLRYWYQDEGWVTTNLTLEVDYKSLSGDNVTSGKAVAAPSPTAGADHYLELSFSGTVAAKGAASGADQFATNIRLHNNWVGTVDVTNDYSYNAGATGYNSKITLYGNGKLISGTEP